MREKTLTQAAIIKLLNSVERSDVTLGFYEVDRLLSDKRKICPNLRRKLILKARSKTIDSPMAVWALGKLYDRKLIPLFCEVLSNSFATPQDPDTIYQTIIALDNLGELKPITKEEQSFCNCIFHRKENKRLAKKYLEYKAKQKK